MGVALFPRSQSIQARSPAPYKPYSPTGCREGRAGAVRLEADGPADKSKTTTSPWWTWTMPESRTTETFSWWTGAPASAGRGR